MLCGLTDMLTDQIAEMHRSPGFINSCLTGKADDGTKICECVGCWS